MGLMISEKKIFLSFSHYKSMGANDHQGMASLDPRGMVGRIYVGYYLTLLHTKYLSSWPHGFREEYFLSFFPLISLSELWKAEFQSDQPQNRMQPFPPPGKASHEI